MHGSVRLLLVDPHQEISTSVSDDITHSLHILLRAEKDPPTQVPDFGLRYNPLLFDT